MTDNTVVMNPETGLPVVPEGYFWSVKDHGNGISVQLIRRYTEKVEVRKYGKFTNRSRDVMEDRTYETRKGDEWIPRAVMGYMPWSDEVKADLLRRLKDDEWEDINLWPNKIPETVADIERGRWTQIGEIELSSEIIREAAIKVYKKFEKTQEQIRLAEEKQAREAKFFGEFPPNKLD